MSKPSKTKDPGKWAEAEVQKWLEDKSARDARFAFHRYPDARAARGALAAQPADYLVAQSPPHRLPYVFNVEVKETANPVRLPRAKVGQYGKLRMFHLAGMRTLLLVYRSAHDDWVAFEGHELFPAETPISFPFPNISYFTAADALTVFFP